VTTPLDVLLFVANTFERLGVAYVVVGSFASSTRGHPRATADVDFVAGLGPDDVAPLAGALGDAFYADEAAMRRAVSGGREPRAPRGAAARERARAKSVARWTITR
jgi:hypothetical protein